MSVMIVIFFLSGLIEHVSSIRCYTCIPPSFHCTLPLNLDNGGGSNENDIRISHYDRPGYGCQSDYSFNPRTNKVTLILRGVPKCTEINIPNHRVECCYENHCNNKVPNMMFHILNDITADQSQLESSSHHSLSSIGCYTCNPPSFHCTLPFSFDNGDESNENDIHSSNYDLGYACQSDYSFNPRTNRYRLILRGVPHCREINIPNHRVDCCYEDNCNNRPPEMTSHTLGDIAGEEHQLESNSHHFLSSILLIIFSLFVLTL